KKRSARQTVSARAPGENMTRPFHGSELRGLSAVSRSPSFEGRFGRMLRNLPPLLPDDKDLEALARQMVEPEPTGEADTAGDNPAIPTRLRSRASRTIGGSTRDAGSSAGITNGP